MLLRKNKTILICTGDMLCNINLQIGFRVITVFGVEELIVGTRKNQVYTIEMIMLSNSK